MIRRYMALLAAALLALAPIGAHSAALSITAANVSLDSGAYETAVAGEAFSAGAILYLKASDGRYYKAQADGTAEEAGSGGIGIALGTADAAGARIAIAKPGAIVSIGTGTAGKTYVIGTTAGAINPSADIDGTSTNKVTVIAIGIGSNKLLVTHVYHSGSVVP